MMKRVGRDQTGGCMAEYTLLFALIAIACIGSVINTGDAVRSKLNVNLAGVLNAPNFAPTAAPQQPATGDSSTDPSADDDSVDSDSQPTKDGSNPIHNPQAGGAGADTEDH
jgi:Flp pilus assembly pilin Flp